MERLSVRTSKRTIRLQDYSGRFDQGIYSGNVGRVEEQVPRMLIRLTGGKNNNYAIEALEFMQGADPEWHPRFKYVNLCRALSLY